MRVGLIGAGFMAQGLANQIANSVPGMRVAAIYGRSSSAAGVYEYSGLEDARWSHRRRPSSRTPSGPSGPWSPTTHSCSVASEQIDVLVDVTGSVEFGAQVTLEAFDHGKHVILMNAELDARSGRSSNATRRKHGVILSACEGDEPGLQMNLVRWVRGLGLMPRVIGTSRGCRIPIATPRRSGASPRSGARTRRW